MMFPRRLKGTNSYPVTGTIGLSFFTLTISFTRLILVGVFFLFFFFFSFSFYFFGSYITFDVPLEALENKPITSTS